MRKVYVVFFEINGCENYEIASSRKVALQLKKTYEGLGFKAIEIIEKFLITKEMI